MNAPQIHGNAGVPPTPPPCEQDTRAPFHSRHAFSLVEVAIALGLVGYALLALLGLLTITLASSRESATKTTIAQIALQAVGQYDGTANPLNLQYTFDGEPTTNANPHFYVRVSGSTPSVPSIAANLQLLTITITNATTTNIIHASAWSP